MKDNEMTLRELKENESARVVSVGGAGALRQHFLDMGIVPGVKLTVVKFAPMGDPVEVRLRGYELTLRLHDAADIEIERIENANEEEAPQKIKKNNVRKKETSHPAIGEKTATSGRIKPLFPEGHIYTFALVGNQNSGKTTLFNRLTGSNQHVGNFPGVTVDKKEGTITGHQNTRITDLPGIYSMSPYSGEERVSRNFVLDERPDAIINIVDVTNLERNLYLTMQLLEMGRPMVVALNVMDELIGNGGSVDINRMEEMLGVPVVPISAAKNEGVDELITHAMHVARHQTVPKVQDLCFEEDNGGAVHRCVHGVLSLVEDHVKRASLPLRFSVSKVIEGDSLILEKLSLEQNELEMIEHIILQMENERKLDRAAAMADMRFSFIGRVTEECLKRPKETREHLLSRSIDRVLSGKYTAIPIFIGIMALIFLLTFNVIGAFFQGLIESGLSLLSDACSNAMTEAGVNPALHSLVIGGLFEGIGTVLSFLPIVVIMFFFLSLLEDSGYIARVAFFMDRLLRKIGLSGRSIVPLLIGFGCTVPAVMATRTLPSERDRRLTILLTPFMSCSAKLPIYAFFVNSFFPRTGGLVMTALYLLGILMGIINALIYKKTIFKGKPVPFVMELPNYRLPGLKSTFYLVWEKAKDFFQRAFSVILIATLVVWFLKSFDVRFNLVTDSSESMLAAIAGAVAPVFAPLGLNDWRIVTALICGFLAKESVVSTLQVLYPGAGVAAFLTPIDAGTMLIFCLLYTPCVAAVGAVRRELGVGWAIGVAVWQCVIAWLCAFLFRLVAMVFGGI